MITATFNPHGDKLWITVKMLGVYFMPYTYQLWGTGASTQAILTNPIISNNNKILIDDYYRIINDYDTTELLSAFDQRVADVALDIVKLNDDVGYEATVAIWQASDGQIQEIIENLYEDDYAMPVDPIGVQTKKGKVGTKTVKQEYFFIELKSI
jgi:hypothetical protein